MDEITNIEHSKKKEDEDDDELNEKCSNSDNEPDDEDFKANHYK